MRAAICEGFDEAGEKECKEIMNQNGVQTVCFSARNESAIPECDFVFSLSFDREIARICFDKKKSYLSYVYTLPQPGLFTEQAAYDTNVIFISDYGVAQKVKEWCGGAVVYLPSGFMKYPDSAIGIKKEKVHYNFIDELSDWTRGFVRQLIKNQALLGGTNILSDVMDEKVVRELQKADDGGKRDVLSDRFYILKEYYAAVWLADAVEIFQAGKLNEWCEKQGIFCCSYENGVCRLQNEEQPDNFADGIFIVFAGKSGQTGIEQKIYDILNMGGFVLAEFRSEIINCFEIGRHLDVWTSEDELHQKISHYLSHPGEQREIAANGSLHVKKFPFADSIENLLQMIK